MTPWTGFWQGSMEYEYMLRIVLSCLCGFLIGLERTKQQKEAGLRTHILVALGAAIVMIVSKYGFFDVLALKGEFFDVDPSRMGSTILTGISFLGAGIILQRSGAVRGLTTAAGVWVTGGVGIAIGAGMYVLGITCTLLVMFVQIVLKRLAWRADIDDPPDNVLSLHIEDDPEQIQSFIFWLEETLPHARISRMDRKKGKLVLVLLLGERDYKAAPSLLIERPEVESLSL